MTPSCGDAGPKSLSNSAIMRVLDRQNPSGPAALSTAEPASNYEGTLLRTTLSLTSTSIKRRTDWRRWHPARGAVLREAKTVHENLKTPDARAILRIQNSQRAYV